MHTTRELPTTNDDASLPFKTNSTAAPLVLASKFLVLQRMNSIERQRCLPKKASLKLNILPGSPRWACSSCRYRELHAISAKEHKELLHKELLAEHGWKEDEFEAGFHKELASTFFQQYVALVQGELQKGEASG